MDKEMGSADVQGKREAAKRWANYVTADANVGVPWRYLLVSESDVATAKGRGRRSRGSATSSRHRHNTGTSMGGRDTVVGIRDRTPVAFRQAVTTQRTRGAGANGR